MKEIAEKLIEELRFGHLINAENLIGTFTYDVEAIERFLIYSLSGSIPSACFTTGEPSEDGEYVCKVERDGKTFYQLISCYQGFTSTPTTILSFAKLPE